MLWGGTPDPQGGFAMTEINDEPTLSHSERLKIEFPAVMQATYRAMKRFCTPGIQSGISELAELLERSEHSLRNQFGPSNFDHAPTVHAFLQVIEVLQSREAVAEIAALAGCVTIPRSVRAKDVGAPDDDGEAFAAFGNLATHRLRATLGRLQSGRQLSVSERTQAREALFDIVAFAAHLITRVR